MSKPDACRCDAFDSDGGLCDRCLTRARARGTPLTADEIGRLYGLLAVASDPATRPGLPQSWWASLGRDLAEDVPRLLAAVTDFVDAADALRAQYGNAQGRITTPVVASYDRERKNVTR